MAHVIFDFDGTIADTFPVILNIFHKVERRTIPLSPEEEHLVRGAALLQVRMRAIIKGAARLNISVWRVPFIFAIVQFLLKRRMHEVDPFPGVKEVLVRLQQDGHQLFIVSTNSTRNIKKFLKTQDMERYFVKVYGGVRSQKKAKAIQHIMKRYHYKSENTVYVGDENRDMVAAHAAGIKAVAVTWGYNDETLLEKTNPTVLVRTSKELVKALR